VSTGCNFGIAGHLGGRWQRWLATAMLGAAWGTAMAADVYTNRGSFLAQLAPGAYTEDFTGPGVQIRASFTFTGGGRGYTIESSPADGQVYRNGDSIGNYTSAQELVLTFFGAPVTAIGGDFFLADIDDIPIPGDVTLTLSDGTRHTWSSDGLTDSSFRGFVSAVPITSLVFSAPPDPLFNSFDNFTIGAAVPEPQSWLLMALGVVALVSLPRRHVRQRVRPIRR
jgi:hypothetical protein